MNAVSAADHHCVAMLARYGHHGVQQVGRSTSEQVTRVAQHPAPCGVDDIAARQAVMNPRTSGHSDGSLHDIDESGHIVVGHGLAVADRAYELVVDGWRVPPAGRGISGRDGA